MRLPGGGKPFAYAKIKITKCNVDTGPDSYESGLFLSGAWLISSLLRCIVRVVGDVQPNYAYYPTLKGSQKRRRITARNLPCPGSYQKILPPWRRNIYRGIIPFQNSFHSPPMANF